ncbi:family 43 glycosylhydrolase [Bacteroides sp.]|uniref:family 43 glycosylhydrolase n=1 Tax=Bacteroides sp. TaxID=29523 RepID=UPI002629A420|nr:family 43 glycosylhydrolase [Bacteroides sp.]MDD3036605.1 family 43 glycosylhydrolase [Bacteroides sp.]
MNKLIFFLFGLICSLSAVSQENYFHNPVIRGDMPDPSIIRIKDTYYATGTSSEWAPFYPMFTSKDLINWKQVGHVFKKQPDWTVNSFWAPELFYHNNKVYCYYTARQKSTGISYIGVATSDSPLHEFTDHGPIIEYGTESIDAFIYDDNGQLYISWKAYGLDKRPIEIVGSKLSADGLKLEGEPFTLLVDDEYIGMEGQYHFKQGEYYYIVYAAHGCCGPSSDYDVYVARSKNYKGPYEKYEGNPILHGGNGHYKSCGHGTAVTTPDGRMFYLCHAYQAGEGFYAGRQPILQEMFVGDDQWVHFKTGNVALAKQPVPFPGTVQHELDGFEDTFKGKSLKPEWNWNYPYSDAVVTLKNGKLLLSGHPKEGNLHGTVLCLRAETPDYSFETKLGNTNKSVKGLTMYGDDKNLVIWGVSGNKLFLKRIKDNVESTLYESVCNDQDVYLKVTVEKGCLINFYQSKNGKEWNPVQDTHFQGQDLVRWDRVSRPGLIHIGNANEPAEYEYFKTQVKR